MFRKLFLRFPVLLARIGISGWERAMGVEWIHLTTTGRRIGKDRLVLLDIVGRDEARGSFFVISGFGEASGWYKNLRADPRCRARVGGRAFPAVASVLGPEETSARAVSFYRANPDYVRFVSRSVGNEIASEEDLLREARGWILIEIRVD